MGKKVFRTMVIDTKLLRMPQVRPYQKPGACSMGMVIVAGIQESITF